MYFITQRGFSLFRDLVFTNLLYAHIPIKIKIQKNPIIYWKHNAIGFDHWIRHNAT